MPEVNAACDESDALNWWAAVTSCHVFTQLVLHTSSKLIMRFHRLTQ